MRSLRLALSASLLALTACDGSGQGTSHDGLRAAPPAPAGGAAAPAELPEVRMVQAFPGLDFDRPLWIGTPPDKSRRLFVVEQGGRIYAFKPAEGARNADLFLDISGRVYRGHNEEGLLALAFHPKYGENGFLYVWYSAKGPRRHVLARFTAKVGRADPASEFILLEIEKPYGNHNGSTLLFGTDGFLYFSVGDGGDGGDPHRNGQNLSSWLAKVHRIDVDGRDPGKNYAVPKDNPFAKLKDARPETWAYGLRNIWRMSFDRKTGDLWGGDVGQNKYEEVDVIAKGGNYGWRIREGFHPFSSDRTESTLLDPVIEYGTGDGHSVTGGYVYRGEKLKRLQGAYVYADYVSGKIWALRWDGKKVTAWREILQQPKNIASFGEDWDGELYLCVFDGRIYKLEEK